MKSILNIILFILSISFVAICGIIHYQVSQIWGTNNEIGMFVAFFGGIAVLFCAFNGAALLFRRNWREFASIIVFLILGWGTVIGSAWLFNNHDIVPHIELSAMLFVCGLLFAPVIASAVAGDK
jgi:hypothetical protein